MPYHKYMIYPVEHALSTEAPSLHVPFPYAAWGSKNGRIDQKSWKKRWGYNTADRTLTDHTIYAVLIYQLKGGTRNTMYLTASDLCRKKTGTSETWEFRTDTYTTGSISSITDTAVVGSGTAWDANAAADDYFIMDDDHSSAVEPDANWVKISSVTDDTNLTLASAYTKNGTTYKIRRVYTVPSNERWSYCIVGDKLIITNGNTNVQYWDGSSSTYAVNLETALTVAVKARFCIEYADRLVIADYGSTRDPVKIAWSKNGDPTDWTDSTAGSATLLGTENYITGLGKVGAYLMVYRRDSIYMASRTGKSTAPIIFNRERKGIGCAAPWSIVEANATNYFLGRNDFYMMRGDYPEPIGEKIRDKFFDIVEWTEVERTWGQHYELRNEIEWVANTTEGKLGFVYNYKLKEWSVNEYIGDIVAAGKGAI